MADLLTREQMLAQLHEHGADAGSDYNDDDRVEGWLGWTVQGDVLTVTHRQEEHSATGPAGSVAHRWRLVPIDEAGWRTGMTVAPTAEHEAVDLGDPDA